MKNIKNSLLILIKKKPRDKKKEGTKIYNVNKSYFILGNLLDKNNKLK